MPGRQKYSASAYSGRAATALLCPACGRKLPYARAKTNSDRSVRVWTRPCRCGAVVTDTAVFTREVEGRHGEQG